MAIFITSRMPPVLTGDLSAMNAVVLGRPQSQVDNNYGGMMPAVRCNRERLVPIAMSVVA